MTTPSQVKIIIELTPLQLAALMLAASGSLMTDRLPSRQGRALTRANNNLQDKWQEANLTWPF